MFMLKSTHEKALEKAADDYAATLKSISNIAENDRAIDQRAIDAERAITKNLRAQIDAMKPDYELGKKRREQYAKDNAIRKARREAARSAKK